MNYPFLPRDHTTAKKMRLFFGLPDTWEWSDVTLEVSYDTVPTITLSLMPTVEQLQAFIELTNMTKPGDR